MFYDYKQVPVTFCNFTKEKKVQFVQACPHVHVTVTRDLPDEPDLIFLTLPGAHVRKEA